MLLQLAGQLLAGLAVAGDDDRPHDGAALGVGRGDRGGLGDGGVGEQRRLDLEGPDPVAGGEDDVVVAALEEEVAVLVGADQVAGRPPLALEALAVEVAGEEGGGGGGAQLQLALDDAGLDPRQRPAHRALADRLAGEVAGHLAGLGLAVAVGGLEAGRGAEGGDRLRVQRLAGRDHPPQGGQRAQGGAPGQHPVLGRRLAEDVDAERLGEVEPLGGVEAAVVDDRGGAGQPGGEEDVAGRLRPSRRRRAPDQLALARAEPVLGLDPLAEQVAVGVDDAARLAGGAGGEDDQGRVLGVHRLDRGRRLLRAVLVEDRGDLGQGHRRHAVGQLGQQRAPRRRRASARRRSPAARGPGGAAACCRAAPPRPSASRRAASAPTRSGCRPGSSPRRRARPRAPRRRRRARPSRRSVRRSASRAGCPRRRPRRSPAARPASAPSRPR